MQAAWPSEYILLALLCERSMHGYELAQIVRDDEALRTIWRIERSEIYFLLGKLAKGGLIVEGASEREGGPTRVIYEPTGKGREILLAWLQTPEKHARNLRTALLARVYLAMRLAPSVALTLIDAQKQVLVDWLDRQRACKYEDEVVQLVHRLRESQVQATLEVLDRMSELARERAAAQGGSEKAGHMSPRTASEPADERD